MKVWVAKTFHPLEPVRNLSRHKRPILASLMSAVLIISIIFVGSFLLTGQSVSSNGPSYVEIFVGEVHMWNFTMHGPRWYNITTEDGPVTLQVTNITMEKALYKNMSLVSGRNLTMRIPTNATATNVIVYTTYMEFGAWENRTKRYGSDPVEIPSAGLPPSPYNALRNVRMKVVYMHAEGFSAPQGLNLTFT